MASRRPARPASRLSAAVPVPARVDAAHRQAARRAHGGVRGLDARRVGLACAGVRDARRSGRDEPASRDHRDRAGHRHWLVARRDLGQSDTRDVRHSTAHRSSTKTAIAARSPLKSSTIGCCRSSRRSSAAAGRAAITSRCTPPGSARRFRTSWRRRRSNAYRRRAGRGHRRPASHRALRRDAAEEGHRSRASIGGLESFLQHAGGRDRVAFWLRRTALLHRRRVRVEHDGDRPCGRCHSSTADRRGAGRRKRFPHASDVQRLQRASRDGHQQLPAVRPRACGHEHRGRRVDAAAGGFRFAPGVAARGSTRRWWATA